MFVDDVDGWVSFLFENVGEGEFFFQQQGYFKDHIEVDCLIITLMNVWKFYGF